MRKYPPSLDEPWFKERFYHGTSGPKFKVALISLGQIDSIMEEIKTLRSKKDYQKADQYRDKLVEIGYYWEEPKVWTKDNLLGYTHKKLRFMAEPSGELSIGGHIHEDTDKPGYQQSVGYTTKRWQFDLNQTKDGVNKYGLYQFGSHTCPYCKSDKTEPNSEDTNRRQCNACTAKWTPKNLIKI